MSAEDARIQRILDGKRAIRETCDFSDRIVAERIGGVHESWIRKVRGQDPPGEPHLNAHASLFDLVVWDSLAPRLMPRLGFQRIARGEDTRSPLLALDDALAAEAEAGRSVIRAMVDGQVSPAECAESDRKIENAIRALRSVQDAMRSHAAAFPYIKGKAQVS